MLGTYIKANIASKFIKSFKFLNNILGILNIVNNIYLIIRLLQIILQFDKQSFSYSI